MNKRNADERMYESLYSYKWPVNTVQCHMEDYDESTMDNRMYSHKWISGDTKEKYERNKGKPNLYSDKSFIYHLNSEYFRCDDFDYIISNGKPTVVCMGCSFTFGIGLPEEQLWPTIIGKLFGDVNVVNLGVPNGSIDNMVMYSRYISKFNPIAVFSLVPIWSRSMMVYDGWFKDTNVQGELNMSRQNELYQTYKVLEQYVVTLEETIRFHHRLKLDTINEICRLSNVNFHYIKIEDFPFVDYPNLSLARDLAHYGYEFQEAVANILYKEYTNG